MGSRQPLLPAPLLRERDRASSGKEAAACGSQGDADGLRGAVAVPAAQSRSAPLPHSEGTGEDQALLPSGFEVSEQD